MTAQPLVVVIGYEGLATFEFAIVTEIFGISRPELMPNWYRFAACAIRPGLMKTSSGFEIRIEAPLTLLRQAHTVIIPGWSPPLDEVPIELVAALQDAHVAGSRIVSICTGAFVLAAAGLLRGRQATTHWQHTAALAAADVSIRTLSDVLYVDEGSILTSAGSAAGIDLCLHMIRSDFGADHASHVARRLVVPPHREGGQAQIIGRPILDLQEGARLSPLLDQLRRRLDADHSVASMAAAVGMSQRTFIRKFKTLTGNPPADWLLAERMSRARELLETTVLSMEQIAFLCGLGSVVNFRYHFKQRMDTTPSEYRSRFERRCQPDTPSPGRTGREAAGEAVSRRRINLSNIGDRHTLQPRAPMQLQASIPGRDPQLLR